MKKFLLPLLALALVLNGCSTLMFWKSDPPPKTPIWETTPDSTATAGVELTPTEQKALQARLDAVAAQSSLNKKRPWYYSPWVVYPTVIALGAGIGYMAAGSSDSSSDTGSSAGGSTPGLPDPPSHPQQ